MRELSDTVEFFSRKSSRKWFISYFLLSISVDYHHVSTEQKEEDLLDSSSDYQSFVVWVNLGGGASPDSSKLAFSPGSHKCIIAKERGSDQGAIPPAFRELLEQGKAKWHLLDGTLSQPGTLAIFSLRLAHGATKAGEKVQDIRQSWDARIRLRERPVERDVVFGSPGEKPPHWGECLLWSPACHSAENHPQMVPYVKVLLLVNLRMRAEGRGLLPDLVKMILQKLFLLVTPVWIPVAPRPRRYERMRTGVGIFRNYELEETGSDYTMESTSVIDSIDDVILRQVHDTVD